MHIRVVTPITTHGFSTAEGFRAYVDPATQLSQVDLEHGPASIESEFDAMLATPETVARVIAAEREGADAVVIDCVSYPRLKRVGLCSLVPATRAGRSTIGRLTGGPAHPIGVRGADREPFTPQRVACRNLTKAQL